MTPPVARPEPAPGQAVSFATLAMVLATMGLVISVGIETFMQASWEWWILPLACVVLIVLVVAQRWSRRQRVAEEMRSVG